MGSFNDDNNRDLAVVNRMDDNVSVLLGKGDGDLQGRDRRGANVARARGLGRRRRLQRRRRRDLAVGELQRRRRLDPASAGATASSGARSRPSGRRTRRAAIAAGDVNGDGQRRPGGGQRHGRATSRSCSAAATARFGSRRDFDVGSDAVLDHARRLQPRRQMATTSRWRTRATTTSRSGCGKGNGRFGGEETYDVGANPFYDRRAGTYDDDGKPRPRRSPTPTTTTSRCCSGMANGAFDPPDDYAVGDFPIGHHRRRPRRRRRPRPRGRQRRRRQRLGAAERALARSAGDDAA